MRPILVLSFALGMCASAQIPSGPALGLLRSCPPGEAERWGRMALDSGTGRLYVPEAGCVRVLDQEGRQVGEVPGLGGVHSVALAPELGIGIFSNGRATSTASWSTGTGLCWPIMTR